MLVESKHIFAYCILNVALGASIVARKEAEIDLHTESPGSRKETKLEVARKETVGASLEEHYVVEVDPGGATQTLPRKDERSAPFTRKEITSAGKTSGSPVARTVLVGAREAVVEDVSVTNSDAVDADEDEEVHRVDEDENAGNAPTYCGWRVEDGTKTTNCGVQGVGFKKALAQCASCPECVAIRTERGRNTFMMSSVSYTDATFVAGQRNKPDGWATYINGRDSLCQGFLASSSVTTQADTTASTQANPCGVVIKSQLDASQPVTKCSIGTTFGCYNATVMFAKGGCSAVFTCNGVDISCSSAGGPRYCMCEGDASAANAAATSTDADAATDASPAKKETPPPDDTSAAGAAATDAIGAVNAASTATDPANANAVGDAKPAKKKAYVICNSFSTQSTCPSYCTWDGNMCKASISSSCTWKKVTTLEGGVPTFLPALGNDFLFNDKFGGDESGAVVLALSAGGNYFTYYPDQQRLEVLGGSVKMNVVVNDSSALTFHCQQACIWERATGSFVRDHNFLPMTGTDFLFNGPFSGSSAQAEVFSTKLGGKHFTLYRATEMLEVVSEFSSLNPMPLNNSFGVETFSCTTSCTWMQTTNSFINGRTFIPNWGNRFLYNSSFTGTMADVRDFAASLGGTFYTYYQSRGFLEVLNEFSHLSAVPLLDATASTFHCQLPCTFEEVDKGVTYSPNEGNEFLFNGSFPGSVADAQAVAASLGGTFFTLYDGTGWLEVLNSFSRKNANSDETASTFICQKTATKKECVVDLNKQFGSTACLLGETYGCQSPDAMYTAKGCTGNFNCNGGQVNCASDRFSKTVCHCSPAVTSAPTPPTSAPTPISFGSTPAPAPLLDKPTIQQIAEAGPETLVGTILQNPQLSAFSEAISAANLTSTLQGESNGFTVFAPSNDAFATYNALKALNTDDGASADMRAVLLNHIVSFERKSSDLAAGTLRTAGGTIVTISTTPTGVKRVNSASIVVPDITATDGVIHIIDSVLSLSVQQLQSSTDVTDNEDDSAEDDLSGTVDFTVEFVNNIFVLTQNSVPQTNVVFQSNTTYNFTAGATMEAANPFILIPVAEQSNWRSANVRVRLDVAVGSVTWTPMLTETLIAYSATNGDVGTTQSMFAAMVSSTSSDSSTSWPAAAQRSGASLLHNTAWGVAAIIVLAQV
jgi:uncharacterized surface protein with fasciclin (FAS1) repeats